jgi:nitrite reductase/ring-hydroxylating ferredoxin subunit
MSENGNFTVIAKLKDLGKSSYLKTTFEKHDYLIIRYLGQIYVIDDKCPHMGASLSKGKFDSNFIQCPLHKAKFNFMTGEVVEDAKIAFLKMKVKMIKTYETMTKDGQIFIKKG